MELIHKLIKSLKNIVVMILTFCLCTVPATAMETMEFEDIIYEVEGHPSKQNTLTVQMNLPKNPSENRLILRGKSLGLLSQVDNIICDGHPIKEEDGTWSIPEKSRKIQWEISLLEEKEADASTQQSTKRGEFILFSEATSLLRFEKYPGSEIIKISVKGVKAIYPEPIQREGIPLPKITEAPLFVLLNPTEIDTLSEDLVKLKYFQDSPTEASRLPDRAANLRGLVWLKSIFSGKIKETFVVCWCGISIEKMGCTGAAGSGVLLVSYPYNGELPLGDALLLYTPLHEAFHQLSGHFPADRPGWVEESLASYYGVRALQIALPNEPKVSLLIERFHKGGAAFHKGLIAINRAVNEGDRSDYGAFYTKGLSFWAEIEKVLHEQGDSLDHHLEALLTMKYDENSYPIELQQLLKISQEDWTRLRKDFLDDNIEF